MPSLRKLFGQRPQPERRVTISGPVLDERYLPMHLAADRPMDLLEAAGNVRQAHEQTWPPTQAVQLNRQPALRRMATVDKHEQGLFVSWRRIAAPDRPVHHQRNPSRGEELRVTAIKNLAKRMLRRRWHSGELLQMQIPIILDVPEPRTSQDFLLRRTQSEPLFSLDFDPNLDYVGRDDFQHG